MDTTPWIACLEKKSRHGRAGHNIAANLQRGHSDDDFTLAMQRQRVPACSLSLGHRGSACSRRAREPWNKLYE